MEPMQAFTTTHWSVVLNAGGSNSQAARVALETLCRSYWPAIHHYIRRAGHTSEAARDLTQGFFARLLEKDWLARADQERGRFRGFLLIYLKRFLSDERDRGVAVKRGGGCVPLSLDELADDEDGGFEPSTHVTPEQEYDRRWCLATLDNALERLRLEAETSGVGELFQATKGYLGGDENEENLDELSARLGIGLSALKMRLSRWRGRYRQLIREEVAQTVPRASDVDEEVRHLLAALTR